MAKILFMFPAPPPQPESPVLTREKVRRMSDEDLLQIIALTAALMLHRPFLTDIETHNFYLAYDERRERRLQCES
jgi:hypothetical protein